MFGEGTISPSIAPEALEWFHDFDADLPKLTGGMPRSMFEEMEEAAQKITGQNAQSLTVDRPFDPGSDRALRYVQGLNRFRESSRQDRMPRLGQQTCSMR